MSNGTDVVMQDVESSDSSQVEVEVGVGVGEVVNEPESTTTTAAPTATSARMGRETPTARATTPTVSSVRGNDSRNGNSSQQRHIKGDRNSNRILGGEQRFNEVEGDFNGSVDSRPFNSVDGNDNDNVRLSNQQFEHVRGSFNGSVIPNRSQD